MEEYDDSYETRFAEKTEKLDTVAALNCSYWSDTGQSESLGKRYGYQNITQNIRDVYLQ